MSARLLPCVVSISFFAVLGAVGENCIVIDEDGPVHSLLQVHTELREQVAGLHVAGTHGALLLRATLQVPAAGVTVSAVLVLLVVLLVVVEVSGVDARRDDKDKALAEEVDKPAAEAIANRVQEAVDRVANPEESCFGQSSDYSRYFRGLKYVFLSSVGFSLASVVVKLDKRRDGVSFPVAIIALLRAVFGIIFVLFGLQAYKLPIVPQLPLSTIKLALARGVFDFTATCLFYTACTSLPIALATIVYYTSVFWTGIIARAFLGESYDLMSFAIVCFGSLGTLITLWPELVKMDSSLSVSGLLCAVFGSVFQASQCVAGRALSRRGVHWLYQNMAFSIAGICLAPVFFYFFSELGLQRDSMAFLNPMAWDAVEALATMGAVACALVSQVWLVFGMEDIPASTISVMRGLDIPLSMVWAAVLLHSVPNLYQVTGGSVVVVAACSLLAKVF